MNDLMKIKDISIQYGVSTRTLRFYEEKGLITSIRGEDYAYRMYDEANIKKLEQILILRKLDIGIKDIMRIFNTSGSEVVLEVLGKKVEDIDDEVALLHELKEIVLNFIHSIEKADFNNSNDVKILYEKAKEIEDKISDKEDIIAGTVKEIKFEKDKDISGALSLDDKSEYTFENPFKGMDLSNGASLTFKVTAVGMANNLGALITIDGEAGRLYISPTSYIGYNAIGGIFDANMKDYAAVKNYIGEGTKLVTITFDNNGFVLYVNGEKAYDQSIITYMENMDGKVGVDNGRGTLTDYSKILEFLQTADNLKLGYGSWWQYDGGDNANVIINNIAAYDKVLSTQEMQTVTSSVMERFVDYEENMVNVKRLFELNSKLKQLRPHISEFPSSFKAVSSGWTQGWDEEKLNRFMMKWISDILPSDLTPQDFLCHDAGNFMWIRVLTNDALNTIDTEDYEVIDFLGGLYISAVAIDDNMGDVMSTIAYLENWVREEDNFELDYGPGRYRMTHMLTLPKTFEALGYHQLKIFIPVKIV